MNNMGETRLSALSLMGIHYARTVDIDEVVDEFVRVHPRRLFDHSLFDKICCRPLFNFCLTL